MNGININNYNYSNYDMYIFMLSQRPISRETSKSEELVNINVFKKSP
jgi:hypothetical protein